MRAIDQDCYDRIRAAFREKPGNVEHAAREAGVVWRTAQRAWLEGWPRKGLPAIRAVFQEEAVQARAQIEAERAARRAAERREAEEARKQAVEARKQEGQLVALSRAQSLQNLTVAINLAQAGRGLAPVLKEAIDVARDQLASWNAYDRGVLAGQAPAEPPFPRPRLSLDAATQLLNRVSWFAARVVLTAREAMEMERLHLGEPTKIVELVEQGREVSLEELRARREAALRTLAGAERAGGMRVIDGGLSEPKVGQRVR